MFDALKDIFIVLLILVLGCAAVFVAGCAFFAVLKTVIALFPNETDANRGFMAIGFVALIALLSPTITVNRSK